MRGFTILEIVIVIAIGTIVAVLLLSILVNNTGVFYTQSTRAQQGVKVNDALAPFRSSIKQAESITSVLVDGSTTYNASSTVLILRVPSFDSEGNSISNTFDHIVYIVDSSRLYQKIVPNILSSRSRMDQILTGNVKQLLFEYFDGSGNVVVPSSAVRVRLTLILEQKVGSSLETNIATSEAYLRND